ncbi:MAG: 2-phosphosulfolactate phosphatase [Vulcanisaeta sp.]
MNGMPNDHKIKVLVSWFKDGVITNADAYVVVDVLRFSTTVITALDIGFKRVYATSELERAIALARSRKVPLVAEVEGVKPITADMDNSPSEVLELGGTYISNGINELVIRSTAGALLTTALARISMNTYIGSTINASALATELVKRGYTVINIVCAGYKAKEFAIEDFIGAGAIVHELIRASTDSVDINEEGIAAYYLYKSLSNTLGKVLTRSKSGSVVLSTGHEKDIDIVNKVNSTNTVAKTTDMIDNKIIVIEKS